jgi:hypothetical protein
MIHNFGIMTRALLLPAESASPSVRHKGMTHGQDPSMTDTLGIVGK